MKVPPNILHNARTLRGTQTDAEQLMWMLLRGRRFGRFKFRRQHPVGRYILDFYCLEAGLAVELDGGGHAGVDQAEFDKQRTKELEGSGIKVMRFWNNDVLQNTEAVLEVLYKALGTPLTRRCAPPSPGGRGDNTNPTFLLPRGEGGRQAG